MGSYYFKPHSLKDTGNRIPNSWCWRERQIDNSKLNTETFTSHLTNQLPDTSNLEGCLLNGFSQDIKACTRNFFNRPLDDTRSGNPNVDDNIRFTNTVEGTRHKRIVLYCIGKDHQFPWSHWIRLGGFFNNTTHVSDSGHIDPCLSGTDVNRRADKVRLC